MARFNFRYTTLMKYSSCKSRRKSLCFDYSSAFVTLPLVHSDIWLYCWQAQGKAAWNQQQIFDALANNKRLFLNTTQERLISPRILHPLRNNADALAMPMPATEKSVLSCRIQNACTSETDLVLLTIFPLTWSLYNTTERECFAVLWTTLDPAILFCWRSTQPGHRALWLTIEVKPLRLNLKTGKISTTTFQVLVDVQHRREEKHEAPESTLRVDLRQWVLKSFD